MKWQPAKFIIRIYFSLFLIFFSFVFVACEKPKSQNANIKIPFNAKLASLDLSVQVLDSLNQLPVDMNANFVFNFKCSNVYEVIPSLIYTDWNLNQVTLSTNSSSQNQAVNLFQYIGTRPITCSVTLQSLIMTNDNNEVKTYTNLSDPLILSVTPPTVETVPNTNSPVYQSIKIYTDTTTGNAYFVSAGSLIAASGEAITPTNTVGYKISFSFSKSLVNMSPYLLNENQAFNSANIDTTQTGGSNIAPDDPILFIEKSPILGSASPIKYQYRLFGKSFLKNDGDTSANNKAHQFFDPTSVSGTTSKELETVENLGLNFNNQYLNYIQWSYLNSAAILTGNANDPYTSIIKNANACKIFVIADNSNPFYGVTTSIANNTTPTFEVFTDGTLNTPNLPPPPTPTTFYNSNPPYNSLSINQLAALMAIEPNPSTNGVYYCLDIRDHFTATDISNTVQNPITNYNQAPGALFLFKYLNSGNTSTGFPAIPIEKKLVGVNSIVNWGSENSPPNSQAASATNYPELFKYDVLIVYENATDTNQSSGYRYTLIRKNTANTQANNEFLKNPWLQNNGGVNSLVYFFVDPNDQNSIKMHACVDHTIWDTSCNYETINQCTAGTSTVNAPCLHCQAAGNYNAFTAAWSNNSGGQIVLSEGINPASPYDSSQNYPPTFCGIDVASVAVTPVTQSILTTDTLQFTATATLNNGQQADITRLVLWYSENPMAATIDSNTGLASGVSAGITKIHAIYENKDTSTTLTISQ